MKNIFSKLWLADYLSISRILAAVVLVVLALTGLRQLFGWLLLLGLLTDGLDGYIARKRNRTTRHGAHLDSAGDASIFLGAAIGVILFETEFIREHLTLVSIALGIYLFQLGLAYWRYGRSSSFHTYAAKTAAVVQGVFLVYTVFFGPLDWLLYIAVFISILETIEEIILILIFKKPVTDVKGLYWVKKKGKEAFK